MKSSLEAVRSFYVAIGEANMEKLFSLLSEDIEWRLVGPSTIPYFGTYSGIEEVKKFFAILDKSERVDGFHPLEFLEGANTVTVLGRESCCSKVSGKSFQTEWAHIFTVYDGKITRFVEYTDTAPIAAAYGP